MNGVEDDIASWIVALMAWAIVWMRTVRWYRSSRVVLPLARNIRWNAIVNIAECVVILGVYVAAAQGTRFPPGILYILPAFVILQAYLTWKSGEWMYNRHEREKLRRQMNLEPSDDPLDMNPDDLL